MTTFLYMNCLVILHATYHIIYIPLPQKHVIYHTTACAIIYWKYINIRVSYNQLSTYKVLNTTRKSMYTTIYQKI